MHTELREADNTQGLSQACRQQAGSPEQTLVVQLAAWQPVPLRAFKQLLANEGQSICHIWEVTREEQVLRANTVLLLVMRTRLP